MSLHIGRSIVLRSQVFGLFSNLLSALTVVSAASLIDKAIELRSIGGVYGGNQKPTEFLCLLLKLLQIQPEKEILLEYLQADEFKSVSIMVIEVSCSIFSDTCAPWRRCIYE
jgi:hypothetical protein